MSQRTIESPGVEFNEVDISQRTVTPVGTKILVHGFASQGPTNELIQVSTKDELNQLFFAGNGPTNAAEQYFHASCNEVLNSPATLFATRLPYGSGGGTGFDGEYTALAFPASANAVSWEDATDLTIQNPVVVSLTETQYFDIKSGQVSWDTMYQTASAGSPNTFASIGSAAFIVVNDAQSTINEDYEGYYLSIIDNSQVSVSSFQSVSGVFSLDSNGAMVSIADTTLGFNLTGTDTANNNSISEIVETSFNYNIEDSSYDDTLVLNLFRLRTSTSTSDPDKLYYIPVENHIGSLESDDVRNSESFFLADHVNNNSQYIQMYVNPNIANKATIGNVTTIDDVLRPVGSYSPCKNSDSQTKYIGSIPTKVERALALAENTNEMDIDIVVAGGLETVWAYSKDADTAPSLGATFDAAANVATEIAAGSFDADHRTIFNLYNNFCTNTRKDCVHYSDPLRGIFVQGENSKVLDRNDKNFTSDILTPLKGLYNGTNSNYSATYANWVSNYDSNTGKYVWLPFSGWQAAITARMDARLQPWYAPFGLNNGIIPNITDIAVKPNQKQQDALYRVGINPVVFFQGDGFVVWGQKTLQAKPSAFDRINVRRLFLTLERATVKIMRYYVGEPNTVFTRTRVNNVLKPLFDLAANNEGVYDYQIVCDERNNTPTVIDAKELKVDIYIKPVRTAEFILVTFHATRTDQDFSELIG
jgi:hypothetical protein